MLALGSKNAEVMHVTPRMAETWLESNTSNRRLSDRLVQKFAGMMKAGLWHYDGSPIRFDTEGKLIDGQHRLWALLESGTEQDFLVLTGLSPESFMTIDTGKSRSFGDILSIAHPGLADVNAVAAATAAIYRWEIGLRGKALKSTGNGSYVSNETMMAFYDMHQLRIPELARRAKTTAVKVPGMTTSMIALLMWIFEDIDATDADYFFGRLVDGVGLERAHPILALRNYLQRFQTGKSVRTALPTDMAIAVGIKAWNAYRRGDDVRQLGWRAGGASPEQFPVPE